MRVTCRSQFISASLRIHAFLDLFRRGTVVFLCFVEVPRGEIFKEVVLETVQFAGVRRLRAKGERWASGNLGGGTVPFLL